MSEETTEKEERKYFTYMVRCADGSLYTGFTVDDVHRRVAVHNSGKGSAVYEEPASCGSGVVS